MRNVLLAIGGVASDYHLHRPVGVIIGMPVRPKLDDLVIEVDADPAAHADDQSLADQACAARLPVVNDVAGDLFEAGPSTDDYLQLGPTGLEAAPLIRLTAFGDAVEGRIGELRRIVRQMEPGEPGFVDDR